MSLKLTPDQRAEIDEARAQQTPTRRPVAAALEEILYEPLAVLDHGFVRVVDYMGDDAAIVQAARVSYGKGTKKISNDAGLIKYLMRHWHSTPFEMCEIKYHVKLPIFIARQWIRHRTANVNEYSARYSVMDREFYIPASEHIAAQSEINNQGRGAAVSGTRAKEVMEILREDAQRCYNNYESLMNVREDGSVIDESAEGIARELARMNLTLNTYTQWYWKTDLHNLLHFLRLRGDSHAQYEIRAYADVMLDTVKRWVPLTYDAFVDYRQGAVNLSAKGVAAVRRMLSGENVTQENSGLSAREWREMMESLELTAQEKAA